MKQAKIATKQGKTAQHLPFEAATGEPTGKGNKTGSSAGKGKKELRGLRGHFGPLGG